MKPCQAIRAQIDGARHGCRRSFPAINFMLNGVFHFPVDEFAGPILRKQTPVRAGALDAVLVAAQGARQSAVRAISQG